MHIDRYYDTLVSVKSLVYVDICVAKSSAALMPQLRYQESEVARLPHLVLFPYVFKLSISREMIVTEILGCRHK